MDSDKYIHFLRDGLDDDAGRSWILSIVLSRVPSRKNNPPDQAEVSAALEQALVARQPPPGEINRQDQEEQGLSSIDGNNTDADSTSQQTHGSIRTQNTIGAVNALVSLRGVAGNNPGGPNIIVQEGESAHADESKEAVSANQEQQQPARAPKRNAPKNNEDDNKNKKKCP